MSNDKLAATGYVAGCRAGQGHGEECTCKRPTVSVEQDPGYGVKEAWQPQARPGQEVADLSIDEWVGQALGAASACWTDLEGAGVFESTQCAAIADALNRHIAGLCVALVEEGQQRLRVQEAYLRNLLAQHPIDRYDDKTMEKVRAGLRTVLGSEQVITDAITGMQNEGILFRERG